MHRLISINIFLYPVHIQLILILNEGLIKNKLLSNFISNGIIIFFFLKQFYAPYKHFSIYIDNNNIINIEKKSYKSSWSRYKGNNTNHTNTAGSISVRIVDLNCDSNKI